MNVLGSGSGGVDEMRGFLSDDKVQFGLLRFSFGSGSFVRNKFLLVTFKGANISGIKLSRTMTRLGEVKKLIGDTNGEITFDVKEDCNVDSVFDRMKNVFASDDGTVSMESLKKDYQKMLNQGKKDTNINAADGARMTAIEMGDISSEQAMTEVRKKNGPFNWILLKPTADSKMELFNAGTLSIDEMREWLKDDEILYGLVRMGFGSGKFRRNKYVSLWWRGDNVPAMKRSKLVALQGDSIKKVEPFSCTILAHALDELTLDVIVKEVRKCAAIDGDDVSDGTDPYSVEAFLAALDEDSRANAKFFRYKKPKGAVVEVEKNYSDFATVVKMIRSSDGLNWGLFELV